jgi:hypothetical protein
MNTLPVAVRLPARFVSPVTVNELNVRLVSVVMPATVPGASIPLNVPPMIVPVTVRLPLTAALLTVA